MKKNIFYFLLLFCSTNVFVNIYAQKDKPLRVEITAKYNSDSYKIIPFGEKGVMLFYLGNDDNKRQDPGKWYFTLYNTNFSELWTKEQIVPKDMQFMFFDYSERYLYLYFENNNSSYSNGNIEILKIDIDSANVKTYNTVINERAKVTSFKVHDDVVMLTGYTLPSRGKSCLQGCISLTFIPGIFGYTVFHYSPFILTYNLNNGASKIIRDDFKGHAYADDLSFDDKSGTFDITIKNHIPRKTNAMYIDEFSADGLKTNSLKLVTNDDQRKLNTCRIISLNENEKILIGTYNNATKGNKANPAFAGFSEGASGIFFNRIYNGQQSDIKFYNFSKFKNFYSYISEQRALNIMKKAKKMEMKGKELSFNYKLLMHDIIKKDSDYIMVAEAYYPEYHTITYTSFDMYGHPITTSYTIFDGYRYTNAIIACFNSDGELLWDNSFEIWNILTFNLKERVNVMFDGDDILLTYSNNGNIASKIIHGSEVVEGKQYTQIESTYTNDKLISDYNSDMEYWYGNYFISYGYQKIKNVQQNKGKRTVFYFNKIAFQ
ncbi:MAG TPA: hypothetical protein PKK00_11510 [Bacteroidales bacterium]|nr:hypothetical protein [Bacteroidales bacterium]HPS18178.1 hypothetical protein [Bacteroidales bacterium]